MAEQKRGRDFAAKGGRRTNATSRRLERSAWMVTLIDCMLTLSFSPSTMVRKNAMIRLRASVASNTPARTAQAVPLTTVASNQGNR